MQRPSLYWLELNQVPIFKQLQLEEALIRTDTRNICVVNIGSPRAIVMGISGQPELLLDISSIQRDQIPVIKRFSGGGTVIIDEKTLFISFLFNKEALDVPPFPEPLMQWSTKLYQQSWNIPDFSLQAQDYTIGSRKCGGNAQYIRKDRWLHHTSFLWDYEENNMNYLLLPTKRPTYRGERSHTDFLCRLKHEASSPQILINQLKNKLSEQFSLHTLGLENFSFPSHRQSTHQLTI